MNHRLEWVTIFILDACQFLCEKIHKWARRVGLFALQNLAVKRNITASSVVRWLVTGAAAIHRSRREREALRMSIHILLFFLQYTTTY